ncbi:MAG TPA: ABC transporter permease [Vicinamibacteria bacterium]
MESLWRDIKYAARVLAKARGFTAVAVATLALGIGANTAIFSVIHAVLLRPLPYPEADRLMFLTEWTEPVPNMSFSIANLKDVRDRNRVFESLVGYNGSNFILTSQGADAERVNGRQVTSGLFATLRKEPILGRGFGPQDDKPGTEGVVLLGEGFWERRFGRDPKILGQTLLLSGESFTVIGVMPRTLHGTWWTIDVFTPLLRLEDRIGGDNNRDNHPGIYAIARLKPGVTMEAARTDVVGIAQQLAEAHPKTNTGQSMTVAPLLASFVGNLRPALMLLLGAVAFVLLIACANVANLLLARAAGRHREIAVRMALGGERRRLLRQLLTESVLLSLGAGVLGVLLAFWGVRGLVASLPANVPRADEIGLDVQVLAFTLLVSLLTGLLFGIAPAWKMLRTDMHDTLKEGGRGMVGGGHRLRNGLVVAEVSLSLILLVGAGLLLRSFFKVIQTDPGFRPEGVLTAAVPLPPRAVAAGASAGMLAEHPQRAATLERVLEQVRALPGVESAAATVPLLGGWQSMFSLADKPEGSPGRMVLVDIARVSPDYFRAMGIRLLQGRAFDERDRTDAPLVCMVDERFVRDHWPGENPLGKRMKFGDPAVKVWMEVVGVVAHVKNYGVDQESRVEVYLPFLQNSSGAFTLVVRSPGDPAALTSGVRAAVRAADPELPVYSARTLEALVSDSTAQRRLAVLLISVFAALALVLAAVGIYGVMSYAVTQRTPEIGIRMALGAERDHIVRMVLRSGAAMALSGVGIGLVAALGLARLIATLLFQVGPADPPTFSVVPVLLLGVALLACYLPARRATKVDPIIALRRE